MCFKKWKLKTKKYMIVISVGPGKEFKMNIGLMFVY